MVSDNALDTKLKEIGVSSDFQPLERQNGKSREIEKKIFAIRLVEKICRPMCLRQ